MSATVAGNAAQAQLGIGGSQAAVTDWFQQQLLAALSDPLFNIPKAFETWIVDRVAVAGLSIPIGQILGFPERSAQFAGVAAHETTTSGTYDDLTTAGPELTGLSDGQYIVLFGCWLGADTAGDAAHMSIDINAAGADDSQSVIAPSTTVFFSGMRAFTTNLSDVNNTLTAKYRNSTDGRTSEFQNRWLIALKSANA